MGRTPCHAQGSTPFTMVSSRTTETSAESMSILDPQTASSCPSFRSGETNVKNLHGTPFLSGESLYLPLEKATLPSLCATYTMWFAILLASCF